MNQVLKLSIGIGWLVILALLVVARPAAAQFASPTVDGTIAGGEYGIHTNGQNQQTSGGTTWYMTWDATNLYVGISGANTGEGAVLYLDKNPLAPINGGANSDGTLVGQAYDNTSFAALQFRADLVIYAKSGYREYRTADGANGWSGPTAGFGSFAESGGAVREFSIPWSAIGGRPAAFAWFGYVTSAGGFVYGQAPTENSGGSIGTAARYVRYYTVSSTTDGASTAPFSRNSYVFNSTTDITGFSAISVYDFTMNTSGRALARGSGDWTIAGNLRVNAGTVSFGATTSAAAVSGDVVIGSGGTLNLSTAAGGDLSVGGNWTMDGAFNANSRNVTFNGSSLQTIGGAVSAMFYDLTINNSAGVTLGQFQFVGRWLTLSNGDLNLSNKSIQLHSAGGGIAVSGARNIAGVSGSQVQFSGNKTITGGTLTFGPNVITLLYAGVDFGPSVSTVNGPLYIFSGGSVNTNPPTYGPNSTLIYGTQGAYNRGLEWSAASGPGYPSNVQIYLNTTLNYDSGNPAANKIANILQINSGSTLLMGNVTSPLAVGGNVNFFGTLSLGTAAGGDLKLGGSFYNAGVFNPNGRAVIFNGADSQLIWGTVDTIFDYLTIENSGPDATGVWLQRNATVNNGLTLTDGMLKVQDKNLTLGAGASVSGGSAASMVVTDIDGSSVSDGFLCKVYAGIGSFTFPVGDAYSATQYSPAQVGFYSDLDNPSTVCVRVTNARHPNWPGADYPAYITRYWTATSTDNAFAGLAMFFYNQADVVTGSQTEAALYHKIWNGASWTTGSPVDANANTFASPVSSFSDHTAFSGAPLAVTLASFSAEAGAEGVTLAWETVSEMDNAGFNVYRADSEAGPWARLNDALIAAAAPGSSEGHSYTWTDGTAAQGATYWYALEDVALDGTATRHAPVVVTLAEPNAVGLAGFSAAAGYNSGWAGLGDLRIGGLLALALGWVAARRRR